MERLLKRLIWVLGVDGVAVLLKFACAIYFIVLAFQERDKVDKMREDDVGVYTNDTDYIGVWAFHVAGFGLLALVLLKCMSTYAVGYSIYNPIQKNNLCCTFCSSGITWCLTQILNGLGTIPIILLANGDQAGVLPLAVILLYFAWEVVTLFVVIWLRLVLYKRVKDFEDLDA